MSAIGPHCPSCARAVSPGQHFCPNCGQQFATGFSSAPTSRPIEHFGAPVLASYDAAIAAYFAKARSRIDSAMLLFVAAFALLWVPYLSYLGSLLALTGVVLFALGRKAFDEPFRRWVVRGVLLVGFGLGVAVYTAILYAADVASAALTSGETLPALVASLQPALETFFAGTFFASILLILGYVALPYGAADSTSRRLLWTAALSALALSALQLAILWPQILPALSNVASGGAANLGAIQALQTEALELGLIQILPDMIFLYAYYRTRARLFPPQVYPPQPGPPLNYGRTG